MWGWVENPATTGMPSRSTSSASSLISEPWMPGSTRISPSLAADHDRIGPDPFALTDPDAVGHLGQHRTIRWISPIFTPNRLVAVQRP